MRWGRRAIAAMGGVLPADAVGFDKSAEAVTAKYEERRHVDAAAVSDAADCGRSWARDRDADEAARARRRAR